MFCIVEYWNFNLFVMLWGQTISEISTFYLGKSIRIFSDESITTSV